MSDVGGINGVNGTSPTTPPGPLTVANALAALRRHTYSSVEISDTAANIARNLDSLQTFASKITAVDASDGSDNIAISGGQYQKDSGILALWAAGAGHTVSITAAKASMVSSLADYVTSVSVADSRANIQSHLNDLQTVATSGVLKEILQTGTSGNLTITTAQLDADQDALGKIKNGAYTLAITGASVNEVLGIGRDTALAQNNKIKSIAIVDTTDAIANHLDDLQKVGLRVKSITQTDPTSHLEITGQQYKQDAVVLGKIITSDMLDVIDASATQARGLSADHRVVTVDVQDNAKNISRNWSFLQRLADDLTSITVTDQGNAVTLTADQFANSDTLLSKFSGDHKLAISGVSAADATTVAGEDNVESVEVSDSSANIVSSLDDLQSLNGAGKLKSISLARPSTAMSMDVSRLQGDQLAATQGVLDKIKGGNYRVAVLGASTSDVDDLADNKRLVSFTVSDTSANLTSSLDALAHLGARLGSVQQSDSGTAFQLTQSQLDTRASVLGKIIGGYTANLTDVTAAKAAADAMNIHVGSMTISDSARNIIARWSALRSLGANLTSIRKSDDGALTLSADNYTLGKQDGLVGKFDADTTFAVTGATLAQAQAITGDAAVSQIDVTEQSTTIEDNLAAFEALVAGDKIHSISNQTPTVSLNVAAADLTDDAQAVLSLIKGGSYALAVSGVDAADAKDLVANNHKIVSLTVTGDASTIAANLSDLNALGKKLTSITQTDAPAETLELTGASYEHNAAALAKIEGGFLAVLTQVDAAKAASFATSNQVSSLSVSDSGAAISKAWGALSQLGSKLTEVTQSDSSNLQLNASDWSSDLELRGKFSVAPTVSLSGVRTSDVADLASQDDVKAIQVRDTAAALSAALGDLASQSKVSELQLSDSTVPLEMTSQAYSDDAALLAKVKNGDYLANLSEVAASDAATLASDVHVSSMGIHDSAANVATNFDALAGASNLGSITLTDADGTISLTAAQIIANGDTLNKISNSFQLTATGAAMADLADLSNTAEVTSVSISDSSANVSANFGDIIGLGGMLAKIQLTDSDPLSLSQADWATGATALSTVDGAYQVDISDALAGDAATAGAGSTVHTIAVSDAAANVAGNWDALVSLYDGGAGKLTGITLADNGPLTLTTDQQTAGAAMIAALLSDATIVPA
jgi:hypothetical protein